MTYQPDKYVIRCDHYDADGAVMGTTHYGPYDDCSAATDAADWLSGTYNEVPWKLNDRPAQRTKVEVNVLIAPPRHR